MSDPGLVTPASSAVDDPASRATDRPVVRLALFAFVVLGMAEITLSVAWKPIAEEFSRDVADIGWLLVSFSVGYVSAALGQHRLARRIGTPGVVLTASAVGVAGAALYTTSRGFGFFAVGSLCFGLGAALTDTALNTYAALRHGARVVSLMTAGFGAGALFGPGLVTLVLATGGSWRVAYLVLFVGELGVLVGWVLVRHRFLPGHGQTSGPSVRGPVTPLRRVLVPVVVVTFLAYVGTEQAFGVWAFWLLTSRGMGDTTARILVTAYWAALTLGRVVVAVVAGRVGARPLLSLAVVGAIVAALVLWTAGPTVGGVAFVLAGFALAGVFPCLVALTPERLGPDRARAVMGWQLAGASIGASSIPALIGLVQQAAGREAIGPALVATSAVLAALHLAGLCLETSRPNTTVRVH